MTGRFAHLGAARSTRAVRSRRRTCETRRPADPLNLPDLSRPAGPVQSPSDLDEFMAQVLARRDDNWRKLQQYVLDEREQAELLGPGRVRLYGLRRDYVWYIRDGVFVRSPVAFDGVTLNEEERRKYEDEWLAREKARDDKSSKTAGARTGATVRRRTDVEALVRLAKEPQFVSAAYFLKFKFEQGRYAFAGPETLRRPPRPQDRVLPDQALHADDEHQSRRVRRRIARPEQRLERQFNKVALVTLWVEPDVAPDRQVRLREHRPGLPAGPLRGPRRRRRARRWRWASRLPACGCHGTSTATAASRSPTAPTTCATSSTTATIAKPPPRRRSDDRRPRAGARCSAFAGQPQATARRPPNGSSTSACTATTRRPTPRCCGSRPSSRASRSPRTRWSGCARRSTTAAVPQRRRAQALRVDSPTSPPS